MKTLILLSVLFCTIAYGLETRKHCWKLNKQIACFRFDEKCKINEECPAGEVCCEYECGTQCRNVDLVEKTDEKTTESTGLFVPSKKLGCPPINMAIRCIWYHQTCKEDTDCQEKNICCSNTCGTFCHQPIQD
jgi:hypothetical protein